MEFVLITKNGIMIDDYIDGLEIVSAVNSNGSIQEETVSVFQNDVLYEIGV